jgi:hypothetical protein
MIPRLRPLGTERVKHRSGSGVISIDPCIAPVSGGKGWRERRKGREGSGEGDCRDSAER